MIIPKTKKEAEELVFYVFLQGDTRNFDGYYFNLIADCIINKAIAIEKEVFSFKSKPKNPDIPGPQKNEKANALEILKLKNLEFKGFEMPFLDYKADILAKKENKTILIECGPCRLWKAINYLEENAELWITRDGKETELFIVSKGDNWDKKMNELRSNQKEALRKVHPVDI